MRVSAAVYWYGGITNPGRSQESHRNCQELEEKWKGNMENIGSLITWLIGIISAKEGSA